MKKIDKSNFVVQHTYDQQSILVQFVLNLSVTYPVKCLGCNTMYCKKCAKKQEKQKQKCPKKCTPQEQIFQQSMPLGIQLRCPFLNQNCKTMSPQQFQIHYEKCEKAPIGQMKKEYLCKEGHNLEFIDSQHHEFVTLMCTNCEIQERLSRSICYKCKEDNRDGFTYCCICRPPLLNRQECPIGHKFKIRKYKLQNIGCGYCSNYILQFGEYCYNDKACNFTLCVDCHNKLPKEKNQNAYQLEIQSQEDNYEFDDDNYDDDYNDDYNDDYHEGIDYDGYDDDVYEIDD